MYSGPLQTSSTENVFEVSLAKLIFSKVPCFQHILLNTIRRTTLKFENYSLKDIILDIKFQWKYIEHESRQHYLANKKQKAIAFS